MKKKFYLQGLIGLAFAGLLFVGCSKERIMGGWLSLIWIK